jgi:hypothetical protein
MEWHAFTQELLAQLAWWVENARRRLNPVGAERPREFGELPSRSVQRAAVIEVIGGQQHADWS